METISERLKQALERLGISQNELSKRTGISKGSISQYVSGYVKPKTDRIYLIAKAMGIKEEWLLGYDVEMTVTEQEKRLKAYAEKLYGQKFADEELITNDVVDNLSVRSVRMAQRFDNVDEDMKRTIEKILSSPHPSRVKIISEEHMDDGSTKVVLRLEED